MLTYRNEIPHSVAVQAHVFPSRSVTVISLGMTTPETVVFDANSFILAEDSLGWLFIDKRAVPLPPGTFLPVNPGQPLHFDAFRRVDGAYLVCVDPAPLSEITQQLFGRTALALPNRSVAITTEIRELLAAYLSEARRGGDASRFLLSACGSVLAACLFREAVSALTHVKESAAARGSIQNAIEFLHSNVERDCSLAEVAGVAHLSTFHLVRVFKTETGKTPHEYLVGIRIAKAKALLADRRFAVKEIAYRCGFQAPGSFSRVFRRMVGTTPREYRGSGGAPLTLASSAPASPTVAAFEAPWTSSPGAANNRPRALSAGRASPCSSLPLGVRSAHHVKKSAE